MSKKHILIVLLLPIFISGLAGENNLQTKSTFKQEYTYNEIHTLIDTSRNSIIDDSLSLLPFFEKLHKLKSGELDQVSILHIGDSHIQAGFLSGRLRNLFQSKFGDAGRGLITPLKLIGTNEPGDYTITSTNQWAGYKLTDRDLPVDAGLTGVAVGTNDTDINFSISSNSGFNLIRYFHHPGAAILNEPSDLSTGIYCPEGESETSTTFQLRSEVNSITLQGKSSGGFNTNIFYGFSLENGNSGVLYHSIGLNGACFEHFNKNPNAIKGLTALFPDLIIISLGTNDTSGNGFREEYFSLQVAKFLTSLADYFPDACFLLTTPIENSRRKTSRGKRIYSVNQNVAHGARVIEKSACAQNIACWNFYEISGGAGSNSRWFDGGFVASDRLHLTREGYNLEGELLFNAMMRNF